MFIIILTIFISVASAKAKPVTEFKSEGQQVRVHLILEKVNDVIWGFDFFPGGEEIIFTERSGSIKILNLKTKKIRSVSGAPEVKQVGQGGLMDIVLHPDFKKNKTVFLSFSQEYKEGVGTVIAQARLEESALNNLKILFRADPPGDGGVHFGSRIVFGKNKTLFFGVGDRGDRDKAQKLNLPNGKLFRISEDGSIPKDNPFVDQKSAIHSIWSLGHRNPQGMAIHPETGELWEQEHGPRGGDEINKIKKGANYGWPIITYGKEYWGPSIGPKKKAGLEQAVKYFVPSIAPSSLMIYSGKLFKKWRGDFFSAALKLTHINRVVIQNDKPIKEERFLEDLDERIRHIKEAPNGEIFFSTDSGKIYQMK